MNKRKHFLTGSFDRSSCLAGTKPEPFSKRTIRPPFVATATCRHIKEPAPAELSGSLAACLSMLGKEAEQVQPINQSQEAPYSNPLTVPSTALSPALTLFWSSSSCSGVIRATAEDGDAPPGLDSPADDALLYEAAAVTSTQLCLLPPVLGNAIELLHGYISL